ncbi:MAG: efflux RND transporter permease subunit [Magnetococcales bacterium]|nr:efflux RND transporter permease subunit [Magnetococcales bacterium]
MSTTHQPTDDSLGVAGKMAKAFIESPLSPLLLFACLAMGLLGLMFTPRQEDPQISVPMVDIFVSYSGASSEQVATLVTEPLERIMSEIQGVKHVYSASMREQAMITVEFDVGEDMEESIFKLYDKIESNMDRIPPGVRKPLVKPKAVDDVPVVALTLWSNDVDDAALRTLGLDVLQKMKEVPNTSLGFVVGGRTEQIRVEVYPERLSGFGISLDQIAGTIKTANSEQGIGNMEAGGHGYKVYTGAFLKNAQEVARLVVGTRHNAPIYIGDVARVFSGPEETRQMVTYYSGQAYPGGTPAANGAPAVTLAIAKKKGSNGVTVAEGVLQRVEELKGNFIPDNVFVAVTRNYGETANEKVNELLFKLFIATMAVMFLVWAMLGLRPAIVTLVVIPVVILMTVFAAWIMEYTIDRVSLFALIFSIGILVDDAIVVVENIYRRWLLQHDCCVEISVDAVREVGNPTILATFTVIAALLPMGFVSGMMGPYMEPIPALGSVAMLFSLFAAFIFTPWLAQIIKPSMDALHKYADREHASVEKLEGFYRWLIPPLVDNRGKGWMFLGGLVVVFFMSLALFYTTDVTVKILPLDNKPEFNVVINMPEGTALPKTANLAQQMTEELRKQIPEVTALQTYVGTASPYNFNGMVRHYYLRREAWHADIQVQLKHKSDRERTSHDLAVFARKFLTPMAQEAGAKIQVVEMPPGPPVLQSVVAEVTGPDPVTRVQVAQELTRLFEKSKTIVDVDNYIEDVSDIWRFEVDTEKAVRRGVSVDAINRNLAMAMGGVKLGDVKRGTVLEPTYIVIQAPLEVRSRITSLGDLPITTPTGSVIPLGELGRFVKGKQDSVIYHKDLRPVEYVTGEVEGRLDAPIYGMSEVEEMLESYTTPDGVTMSGHYLGPPDSYKESGFEWTGEWTVTYETFRDMGMAFGVALVLIYMLVVWEFGNFTLPAIIMAPIPLTLIGIVPGHWMLDAKFTATSMIGFIALAGIIVRNSILLVDFSQQEILRGTPVREAVILACKARTRPIVITALALVAGSSVILTDFIFQGMAISLLFGALVSTLLTLLVIPLGCISAESAFRRPEKDVDLTHRALAQPELTSWGQSDTAIPPQTSSASCEMPKRSGANVAKTREFLEKYNPEVAAKQTKSEEKKRERSKEDPQAAAKDEKSAKADKATDKKASVKAEAAPAKEAKLSEADAEQKSAAKKAEEKPKAKPPAKKVTEKPAAKVKPTAKKAAEKSAVKVKPAAKKVEEKSPTPVKPAAKKRATAKSAPKSRKTTAASKREVKAEPKVEEAPARQYAKPEPEAKKSAVKAKPAAKKAATTTRKRATRAKSATTKKPAASKTAAKRTATKRKPATRKTAAAKPAAKKGEAAKSGAGRRRGIRLKGSPKEEA